MGKKYLLLFASPALLSVLLFYGEKSEAQTLLGSAAGPVYVNPFSFHGRNLRNRPTYTRAQLDKRRDHRHRRPAVEPLQNLVQSLENEAGGHNFIDCWGRIVGWSEPNHTGGYFYYYPDGEKFGWSHANRAGGYDYYDHLAKRTSRSLQNNKGGYDFMDRNGELMGWSCANDSGGYDFYHRCGLMTGQSVPNEHGGFDFDGENGTVWSCSE